MRFPEQEPTYYAQSPWHAYWYGKLKSPVSLSQSTFQPSNQWIWKLPYSLRATMPSPVFTSHFTIVLVEAAGGKAGNFSPILKLADLSDPVVFSQDQNTFHFYVQFPYPPAFAPPADINVSTEGQTVNATISVTGAWNGICDKDWCHIDDPANSSSSTVHVTVDPNSTKASRTATITFNTSDGIYSGTTEVFQSPY
jgi:hypothetical protein